MKILIKTTLILGFLYFFTACQQSNDSKKTQTEYKLPSKGDLAKIIIVMDRASWNDTLGGTLRSILADGIPGLPGEETIFDLIQVVPEDFNRLLKRQNNVLFITSLANNSESGMRMKAFFTRESLNAIQKDESKFIVTKSDEYATGQRSMYLFGKNDLKIIEKIRENKEKIIDYFQNIERERMQARLYGRGETEQKKLNEKIEEITNLSVRIPQGYQLAKQDSNFVWLRFQGVPADKNITISWGEYGTTKMFDAKQIVDWRNHFGFKSLNDTTLNESYMNTQDDYVPVYTRKINANGNYAVEYRGMWKLQNKTRGGAFVGFAFVDEQKNRFYYIEGFVYAPAESKRKSLMELDAILRTFQVRGKKV